MPQGKVAEARRAAPRPDGGTGKEIGKSESERGAAEPQAESRVEGGRIMDGKIMGKRNGWRGWEMFPTTIEHRGRCEKDQPQASL